MGICDQTRMIQLNGCVIGVEGTLRDRGGLGWGTVAKERKELLAKTNKLGEESSGRETRIGKDPEV